MMESQEYQRILVGIDGSDQAKQAFYKALSVAKRNHATIIIAHVIENRLYGNMGYNLAGPDLIQQETDHSKELLAEYKELAQREGVTTVETILAFGSAKVLMGNDLPAEHDIDLIMVGQSGLTAVEKFMIGSVSDYVIRHAPCDVLVVRLEETKE